MPLLDNYAPYLDTTIPAFDSEQIVVPFIDNPGATLYRNFRLKIKNLNASDPIAILEGDLAEDGIVVFNLKDSEGKPKIDNLKPGQYYEVQLAYHFISTGLYSSAAITKYIGTPVVDFYQGNYDINIGITVQYISDSNEPITDYKIIGIDPNGEEILNTGWQIHGTSEDAIELDGSGNVTRTAYIQWVNNETFFDYHNETMKVKCEYKTLNNYSGSIERSYFSGYTNTLTGTIDADLNYEAGAINIIIDGIPSNAQTGNYQLIRTIDKIRWDVLTNFNASSKFEFTDLAIEPNIIYQYAILRRFGPGAPIYMSPNIIEVTSNFEDIFLSDKDRQLRVRFNPKISSFKTTIIETKTDTIGGKYPFFFRNGNVEYKEFPINGLISYWMDEQEDFISRSALGLDDDTKLPTTNLTDYNIVAERKMKLEVLNWLNNGKPKLFRSPTEGNYLVRLMNVSLTPEDRLSRMIHSFSATAYECGSTDIESLRKNDIIPEVNNG